jgi:hypothetical protein
MGFSGGGSNVLKPHKHSNAVQDGSPLNMNNVTEASLTAGDIVYSDGNALQSLSIGTPAQQIKVNALATAPEYFTPAVSASNYEFLGTASVTAGTTLPVTFTEVQPPDYVIGIFTGTVTPGQGNDIEISADTNANYDQIGNYTVATTQTQLSTLNQVRWNGVLGSISGTGATCKVEVHTNPTRSECYAFIDTYTTDASAGSQKGFSTMRGQNSTAGQTGVTAIRFFSGSNFTGTLNVWAVRN